MKLVLILITLKLLLASSSFGQLLLEFESIEFINETHVQVMVKIQNLGSTASAFIPYGHARQMIDPNRDQPRRIDALLKYRPAGSNDIRYDLPTSITIKTWFGTSIEPDLMESIPSTGASNFYRWELIFRVPQNALDVSFILFGESESIPNRPEVIEKYEQERVRASELVVEADSLFEKGNYSQARTNYSIANRLDSSLFPSIAKKYFLSIKYLGDEALNNNEIENAYELYDQANRIAKRGNVSTNPMNNSLITFYEKKGFAELNQSNYGNAYFFFNEVLSIAPDNEIARREVQNIVSLKRSPTLATTLSLVPGGGQFYNKNSLAGLLFMASGSYFMANGIINYSKRDEEIPYWSNETPYIEKAQTSFIFYTGITIWSMFNANRSVKRYNQSLTTPNDNAKNFQMALAPSNDGINFAFRIHF